jgi:hypothetical protein
MFRQYRKIERGEFFLIGGDCSQGGEDSNVSQFLSKTKLDIPLVYDAQGVAASMTPQIHRVAEKLYDITGIPPVIGFERNMGGSSEMERLRVLNTKNKYSLFVMPVFGDTEDKDTNKLGWDTNTLTRPILVGDEKNIIDVHGIGIYDKVTIQQLFWFIISRQGKPEAMKGKHDDHVISLGVAWQMSQNVLTPLSRQEEEAMYEEIPDDTQRYKGSYY